jgi:phage terminase large subunit
MKVSVVFTETLRDLRYGVRRLRHQGGQYSGKTVNVLAALSTLAAEDEPGVTTVTSMSFPHLKGGALRDYEMFVYPSFKSSIKKYHKTDHLFTFKSGHLLEFKVFENEFAARGQKRKRLFVNEANKFDYMTYWQLDSRSEQTIIDYNPTIRFWAHEKLENDGETKTYITNHWHNPFLSDAKHQEIERICIFKRDEYGNVIKDDNGNPLVEKGNYEQWKVYARGLTGNVTGIIFPNWEIIDDDDFPKDADQDWIFSVDFGYTNDPTAIVKICRVANTLFIKELAYETGLSPISIRQILVANGYKESMPLYCEHDPEMIRLLRNLGIQAFPARKGQGSVNGGIELINSHAVKYPCSSRNLHRERGMYIWETDKKTGDKTNMPVDANNHLMDACRYGVFTKYLRNNL